ncbi:LysR family transcriptional regulator [Nocardiopsis sp. CNR-923]|uniref:LysR family transcriptional regulator n=1 Tax=Nocardiopsis sp. CNR-923 TaxID=1904965 RepID=UPI000959FCC6|nr:LysR family transcriptional regulator [Nocardiopsis sp. CNR-923]OLT25814.1 LysR family transcriptional regulator [Nocardiopsis sp. CNR-923]
MGHKDGDDPAAPLLAVQPDLNLLRTFLAVYRSGSFTAAAGLLGLSQPTVTTQIRNLERTTGRDLFERLPRGATPTPVAHDLAASVSGPLDALAAATGHDPEHLTPTVPVHLAGPAEYLSTCVLPFLAPLIADGLHLRVTTGLADSLLDELRAGRYDLVISTTRPRGRNLLSEPLADEEFALVAAPVWADRVRDRLAAEGPSVLHEVPLVSYAEDLPIVRRYWRHVFGRRLACRATLTIPDLRGVLSAVKAGAGFSVLPTYLCADALATGALVVLHETDDPPINTSYLAQRPGIPYNTYVNRVRDHLLTPGPHTCDPSE